jgi:hypothetical protein
MHSIFKINPKVALLDDDIEFNNDFKMMYSSAQISIDTFTSRDHFIESINKNYQLFKREIKNLIRILNSSDTKKIEEQLEIISKNRPYSVVLIDLNLNNDDEREGLSIKLPEKTCKKIIYTGEADSQLGLSMVNDGVCDAYISKDEDVEEVLLPCISRLNQAFYDTYINSLHTEKDLHLGHNL